MGSIFPMKEIDERINEIILPGGEKQATVRSSLRAQQFMHLRKRSLAEKSPELFSGSKAIPHMHS